MATGTPGETNRSTANKTVGDDDSLASFSMLTRGLLEQVLQETESDSHSPESPDLAVLVPIVRKYAGCELRFDPVLVELVEAMLIHQFAKAAPKEDWKNIARQVAEQLFEDLESQRRLHELWSRLRQSEQ